MKNLLIIAIIIMIPVLSFGQHTRDNCDCTKYIETVADKSSGFKEIRSNRLSVITHSKDNVYIYMKILESKHKPVLEEIVQNNNPIIELELGINTQINSNDYIDISFRDSTRLNTIHHMTAQREPIRGILGFTIYLDDSIRDKSLFDFLLSKKIKAVYFHIGPKIRKVDFTEKNSNDFYNQINCLNNLKNDIQYYKLFINY